MSQDREKQDKENKTTAERLVEVAGQIFAAKGSDATVREICKAAGCSVAAINYYFGDKNQLYRLCVQSACEQKQRLFPLPEFGEVTEKTAPDQLREFLQTISRRIDGKADSSDTDLSWRNTLMLREILSPSEGVLEMLQTPFQSDFAKLNHLVGVLLGEQLNTARLRQALVTQILARCMFLRTGKNLRKMFHLDSKTNEESVLYANCICDSILFQINGLRRSNQIAPLLWSSENNSQASVSGS